MITIRYAVPLFVKTSTTQGVPEFMLTKRHRVALFVISIANHSAPQQYVVPQFMVTKIHDIPIFVINKTGMVIKN